MTLGRWLSTGRGAGEMIVHLAAPWKRSERTRWGAHHDEIASAYPGDELVPNPSWEYTHAITIAADRSAVWPWILQIGQGRGGFYSFEGLENLVGCQVQNLTVVRPELQQLAIGDPVRLHPKSPPLEVRLLDAQRHLVLAGNDADGATISSWAFHLLDDGAGTTRLVERGRYCGGSSFIERLTLGPSILEPVSFVMSREMLRNIKGLAERQ